MLVIFQQWVKSHLRFWFLHTALEQLPTVYGCDKGHSQIVPEWRKESSSTDTEQGQQTVPWLLNKCSVKRDTKLSRQHPRIQMSEAHDRTTTQLQPSWGNNQGHRPEPTDSSWIKGEPQQDSQLFPQQSDSGLRGCTIPKMSLSTGSQMNCWRMGYFWPWHLPSYKYLLFLLLVMLEIPLSAMAAN